MQATNNFLQLQLQKLLHEYNISPTSYKLEILGESNPFDLKKHTYTITNTLKKRDHETFSS